MTTVRNYDLHLKTSRNKRISKGGFNFTITKILKIVIFGSLNYFKNIVDLDIFAKISKTFENVESTILNTTLTPLVPNKN
jgi:hypothetical protein